MCTSGSRMPSNKVRSSSVSAPICTNSTFFPQSWAISRTKRGNFDQTWLIDCMRVFIMRSCNSRVTVSILLTVLLKAKSPLVLANDSRRLRASTISLTKFMSLSSNSTLTFTGAANSLELSASLTAASMDASLTTSKTSCSMSAIAASTIFSAMA